MVPEAGRAEEAQRAAGLKKVPLDGLMGEADWNGVCLEMRTRGGVFWPIAKPSPELQSFINDMIQKRRERF